MGKEINNVNYSNGKERFSIDLTEKDEIVNLHALTNISYLNLKKGSTIQLNRDFVKSIIEDDEMNFSEE